MTDDFIKTKYSDNNIDRGKEFKHSMKLNRETAEYAVKSMLNIAMDHLNGATMQKKLKLGKQNNFVKNLQNSVGENQEKSREHIKDKNMQNNDEERIAKLDRQLQNFKVKRQKNNLLDRSLESIETKSQQTLDRADEYVTNHFEAKNKKNSISTDIKKIIEASAIAEKQKYVRNVEKNLMSKMVVESKSGQEIVIKKNSDDRLWHPWTSWSSCSKTCGSGISSRSRLCALSKLCKGIDTQLRPCENESCPIYFNSQGQGNCILIIIQITFQFQHI